ncbi:hypothetical protein sos41_31870 [Alphaproteobacteria bacterium SO-S41]|nr:hypothetical protein sos41_31870 [Alphaproteobacteria bacterium SO-S41]
MVRSSFGAAVFAVAGFALVLPAQAGKVQDAKATWESLEEDYDKLIDSIEAGKSQQPKKDVADLRIGLSLLRDQVNAVADGSHQLADELSVEWAIPKDAIANYEKVALDISIALGSTKPDVNSLTAAKGYLDDSMPKALEATKTFGRKYGDLMKMVEQAKNQQTGTMTSEFNETAGYLDTGAVDNAISSIRDLRGAFDTLSGYVVNAQSMAEGTADSLEAAWKPAYDARVEFDTALRAVESALSNDNDYHDALGDMIEAYGDMNAAIVQSHATILDFGTKLTPITDDWK